MSEELARNYVRPEQPRGAAHWLMLLVNPFPYIAGWQALGLGMLVMVATALLAVAGRITFDGALDIHMWPVPSTGYEVRCMYAVPPVAAWLTVAIVFWLTGAIFSRSKQRAVDYFGTTALARTPYLIAALLFQPALLGGPVLHLMKRMAEEPMAKGFDPAKTSFLPELPWVILAGLAAVLLGIWLVAMYFFALKESSGMPTGRAVVVFVGAAIVAEIASKLLLILGPIAAMPAAHFVWTHVAR